DGVICWAAADDLDYVGGFSRRLLLWLVDSFRCMDQAYAAAEAGVSRVRVGRPEKCLGFRNGRVAAPSDAVRGFPGQHGAGGVFLWSAVPSLVLEADVRLLTNPLLIRAAALFLCAGVAFAVGAVAIRLLRRGIEEEGTVPVASGAEQSLPVQAYAVIQQLKQQKFVLQNEQQMQRRRTKMSEQITAAIIANLPIGMLFIGPNGLVRQANAAARPLLGFALPMGKRVPEAFR